jgi:hypothetical protein
MLTLLRLRFSECQPFGWIPFFQDGVCDPLAVKAKPFGQKTPTVLSPGRPSSGPHHSALFGL